MREEGLMRQKYALEVGSEINNHYEKKLDYNLEQKVWCTLSIFGGKVVIENTTSQSFGEFA
jgi:hypothetical protein